MVEREELGSLLDLIRSCLLSWPDAMFQLCAENPI